MGWDVTFRGAISRDSSCTWSKAEPESLAGYYRIVSAFFAYTSTQHFEFPLGVRVGMGIRFQAVVATP